MECRRVCAGREDAVSWDYKADGRYPEDKEADRAGEEREPVRIREEATFPKTSHNIYDIYHIHKTEYEDIIHSELRI
jgi:hypothetical protein